MNHGALQEVVDPLADGFAVFHHGHALDLAQSVHMAANKPRGTLNPARIRRKVDARNAKRKKRTHPTPLVLGEFGVSTSVVFKKGVPCVP